MSDDYDVEINYPGLDKNIAAKTFKAAVTDLWGQVRRAAPSTTGRLAGSFQINKVSDFYYNVSTNVLYANFVNDGTGIFGKYKTPIVPVRANSLAFSVGGGPIFRKSVKGQKAQNYVNVAIENAYNNLDNVTAQVVKDL